MKTLNKQKSTKKIIIKTILGFIIGISLGYGITKMVKSNNSVTSAVEKTIEKNCNCETVSADTAFIGIQFSSEDGVTGQKASYILENCNYKSSTLKEAQRINEQLQASVADYEALDLIELTFKSNGINETVKIKNGKII